MLAFFLAIMYTVTILWRNIVFEGFNSDSPFVDVVEESHYTSDYIKKKQQERDAHELKGDKVTTLADLDAGTSTTREDNITSQAKKRIAIFLPGLKINYRVEACIFKPDKALLILAFDENQEYSPEFQETTEDLKIKLQLPDGETVTCSYMGQEFNFNGFKFFILIPEEIE